MENNPRLKNFVYAHLPPKMQAISKPFCELANVIVTTLPDNDDSRWALHYLMLAKDQAVRSAL